MKTIQLKEKLISKINNINDKAVLKLLLMNVEFYESTDKIHIMTPGARAAVEEGLAKHDRGEWISNEEANRQVEEWLKKS